MKSLHIRDIDEETLDSLKRLARRHHRSLQGELHHIIEKASFLDLYNIESEDLDLITVKTSIDSSWSREDIYDNGR